MAKATLEEKNEAQKQINADNEYLRLAGDSNVIELKGAGKDGGIWRAELSADDSNAVKEFLDKRIRIRINKNTKITVS
jgi:hypothetical protein